MRQAFLLAVLTLFTSGAIAVEPECFPIPTTIVPSETASGWREVGKSGEVGFIETREYAYSRGMTMRVHYFFGQLGMKHWSCKGSNKAEHVIAVRQPGGGWLFSQKEKPDAVELVISTNADIIGVVVTLDGIPTTFRPAK